MKEFKPTYLMVKWHPIDSSDRQDGKGLFYFCKTTKSSEKQILNYKGSGLHWGRHLKKHGKKYVETLWWKLFTNKDELVQTALLFSGHQDIVKSKLWANIKLEDGLMGGSNGPCSEEQKAKISAKNKGKPSPHKGTKREPQSAEHRANIGASKKRNGTGGNGGATKGKKNGPQTEEWRNNISKGNTGIKHGPLSDEHKKKIGAAMKGNTYGKANKGIKKGPQTEEHKANRIAALIKGQESRRLKGEIKFTPS